MTNFHSNIKASEKQKTAKGAEETPEQAAVRIANWKAGLLAQGGRYRNPAVTNEQLVCAELSLLAEGETITVPELCIRTEIPDGQAVRDIMTQLVSNGHLTENPTEFFQPVTLGEDWAAVPDTL